MDLDPKLPKYYVSNTITRKTLQEIEKSGWALKIKGKGTFF